MMWSGYVVKEKLDELDGVEFDHLVLDNVHLNTRALETVVGTRNQTLLEWMISSSRNSFTICCQWTNGVNRLIRRNVTTFLFRLPLENESELQRIYSENFNVILKNYNDLIDILRGLTEHRFAFVGIMDRHSEEVTGNLVATTVSQPLQCTAEGVDDKKRRLQEFLAQSEKYARKAHALSKEIFGNDAE
jgi:hypothetical protein